MCGIAGYFGLRELPDAQIDNCLREMRRRGPDHQGSHHTRTPSNRNVYLLHSRLSIIDLSERSDQPLRHGNTWISFNGELYNYVELKHELETDGETFRTTSDTEVLAAVLDHSGWEGLDSCEGMWALASFNESTNTLMLSRDRFGEKPLYLLETSDGIYFGSEIKFISILLGKALQVDLEQVKRFLVNGYKSISRQRKTFFQGVRELDPAHVIEIDKDGNVNSVRYWSLPTGTEDSQSFSESVKETRERLFRSMELRLRSDVPVAFCMSGGVDSVSLMAIAQRVLGYETHGFTVVSGDPRYDESDLVAAVSAELGCQNTLVKIGNDGFLEKLGELTKYHDAPVATISYYAHWLLMERIHGSGFRISVSGTGADELFSGYHDHHLQYLYDVRDFPDLHTASRQIWVDYVRDMTRNPHLQDPDRFIDDPTFRDHIYDLSNELEEMLIERWSEPFRETHYHPQLLRNRMLNELMHEVVPVILHEDDLNAMHQSIENRSPYLDRSLFEYSSTIPTPSLIRNGYTKAVLREAMRGVVPNAILDNRRKVGFNAPIEVLAGPDGSSFEKLLLNDGPVFELVDRERVRPMLQTQPLDNSLSKFLFSLLTTDLFLREHW